MNIGIYKITSPSGKIYIGQSTNIINRKRTYKYFKNYKNSIGPIIYNSFNKYGWEQHQFEIIEECSLEKLNERETYWKQHYINKLGWKNMLFCELFDNSTGPKSEETKRKISQSKKGTNGYPKNIKRPISFGYSLKNNIERGQKISQSLKNNIERGQKISQTKMGQKLSEETKLKISNSSKGISRNQKSVFQCDLKNNIIKEWSSQTEAGKLLGIKQGDISAVIKGKQKTAGGFKWKEK